jgi:hypothetical protein
VDGASRRPRGGRAYDSRPRFQEKR